jgi:hypothetical protein
VTRGTTDRGARPDKAPTRTAELRVVGIDISVNKEKLRRALASAAGCGSAEVQVGEIGTSRGGLGSAWIKCPVAGARKLSREGEVALGWFNAKVIAILTRLLQCYRCLELGHVRAACMSAVDRGHLCYRCGGSGCRARRCPAAALNYPPCESLGAPAGHRMGGAACASPKIKKRRPIRESTAAAETKQRSNAEIAADGREEAIDLNE